MEGLGASAVIKIERRKGEIKRLGRGEGKNILAHSPAMVGAWQTIFLSTPLNEIKTTTNFPAFCVEN